MADTWQCPHCGGHFERWVVDPHVHLPVCPAKKRQESTPAVTGFAYQKGTGDNTGHFYVGFKGDIRNNHWHLAPDGTVLSVKEGGHHLFRRTDVTRNIRDVCPELDISFLWEG